MVSTSMKGLTGKPTDPSSLNKLASLNPKDLKYLDQQKKLSLINFLQEKVKKDKQEAKEQEEKLAKKK